LLPPPSAPLWACNPPPPPHTPGGSRVVSRLACARLCLQGLDQGLSQGLAQGWLKVCVCKAVPARFGSRFGSRLGSRFCSRLACARLCLQGLAQGCWAQGLAQCFRVQGCACKVWLKVSPWWVAGRREAFDTCRRVPHARPALVCSAWAPHAGSASHVHLRHAPGATCGLSLTCAPASGCIPRSPARARGLRRPCRQ